MAYAQNTKVPVERTIGEIQKILNKAGASGFMFATMEGSAYIGFTFKDRTVKMKLNLVKMLPTDKLQHIKNKEQVNKAKWRGLLLCIKAKIESVESGIETFEEAFLPHILLGNGMTVGDKMIPYMEQLEDQSPAILLGFNQ